MIVTGFPPIIDNRATALVLGSMPGALSLQKGQYYAHPRNVFWRITGELLGFDADADYAARTASLRQAGIALWDVLHICERPGSLDSSIARDGAVPNDFRALLTAHPGITRIFFNGGEAARRFERLVQPGLIGHSVTYRRLPSTSPANASIPYDVKLQAWRQILEP